MTSNRYTNKRGVFAIANDGENTVAKITSSLQGRADETSTVLFPITTILLHVYFAHSNRHSLSSL